MLTLRRPDFLLPAAVALIVATAAAAGELADRIEDGDRRAAIALIENGADVNAGQGDGTTPLHWAVYHVDTALTKLLLEHGAVPDVVNAYGSSPLAEAAKVGEPELVELLLDAGADVEAPNADGQTVLMLAARSGSTEIARQLIAHGADVNAKESWRGQTALIWAADSSFPEIVNLLIGAGAEVDFRAKGMDWPVQITSEPRAQYRPVGGLTPLLYAARSGCTACARSIVEAGAAIDRPTPEGMTPLMIAIDNGAFDTAAMLLERGADPRLWDWYGRTALYIAVDMNNYRRGSRAYGGTSGEQSLTGLDIERRLLEAGVDPNPQLNMHRPSRGGNIGRFTDDLQTTGATPLLRAAISEDVPSIRLLLAHGAIVDLPNVMGVTPLMAAAGMGTPARGLGAPVDGSAEDRAIEALGVLLAAGADIDARSVSSYSRTATIARTSSMTEREGETALYGAISRGWDEAVAFLIAHGAEVAIVDARGRSPVDAAMGKIEGRGNAVHEDIAARLRALEDGD
jgi:ankyrin repeat protein